MTREEFWQIIDQARKGTEDVEQIAGTLQSLLEKRNPAEVLSFLEHQARLMEESYSWKLWGAAYLINGGCSDDGFDYFRGWLLAQGEEVWRRALKNPDTLAEIVEEDDASAEDMINAAAAAYEALTGEYPDSIEVDLPELGEEWDFDDDDEMRERYPSLAEIFLE